MPRLTASELRHRAEWDVDIEDGFAVRVRRLDMVQAYMQNLIPMPLMQALDRLRVHSKRLEEDPTQILSVPQQDKEQTIELLQRYACACVVDPIFTMTDDGDPAHCPITMLTSDQLLKIWQSGPKIVPRPEVSAAEADRFSGGRPPILAPVVVPDGDEVPPASVRVRRAVFSESRFL